ncbi:efflux RND transporter periplasmic adaptor subunit [Variovorax dokdonensis]|uniref:Efflux RND transporter periplasmic adaptor subunit n=1 Tax=Variovorax dokdonensis TaxID=344883 RepID=A0ABT7N7H5_9BURK|nr:efflux RND transporter periplasmic adaptor subunit [Variovorax dokdonensis]MDM0043882.1 efflux RND transporter periplasmic adaptor subunit [Variovorax dokdonensis]
MKRWMGWTIALLAIVLVIGGGLRAVKARQAQKQAAAQPLAEATLSLLPSDVLSAQTRELARSLPISGSLRAVESAMIKAKVAGEIIGLSVREGDTVKAGQVLARIDSAEYAARVRQAQQQADSAAAQAQVTQRNYDNNKALVEQGFISRTALDTSLSNLNAAQATHRAAQAGVEVARKSLDDTTVRSPIDGQVASRVVQPGERVGIDAKLLEVVDLRRLELEATVSAADSVAVRVGQRALLQIEGGSPGSANDSRRQVGAVVTRINPSAQAGSRSVLIYLTLDRAEGFRQGLFAQGALEIERDQALALPLSAVRVDQPQPYVQLIEDQRIVHRKVTTGWRAQLDGQTWVSVEGIAPGAQVLSGSVGTVREGSAVRLAPEAPAAPSAPAATRPAA